MKNSIIYILGATVLVGGAYLFLKNKKAKDLAELDKLGGTTTGGTTSGGATTGGTTPSGTTPSGTTPPLSTATDGVAPSDANINLANATVLVAKRNNLKPCSSELSFSGGGGYGYGGSGGSVSIGAEITTASREERIKILAELDKKLADLGYKVDANCQLVKI
jgi:hypothetical protein